MYYCYCCYGIAKIKQPPQKKVMQVLLTLRSYPKPTKLKSKEKPMTQSSTNGIKHNQSLHNAQTSDGNDIEYK